MLALLDAKIARVKNNKNSDLDLTGSESERFPDFKDVTSILYSLAESAAQVPSRGGVHSAPIPSHIIQFLGERLTPWINIQKQTISICDS